MKVRLFRSNHTYVIIEDNGYEMSILVPDGYTPQQALERHSDECQIKAKWLMVESQRCEQAMLILDERNEK